MAQRGDGSMVQVRWQVLIPIRADGTGMSRLRGAVTEADIHEQLVRAIQRDTLTSVVRAAKIAATQPRVLDPDRQGDDAEETVIAGIHVVSGPDLDDLPAGVEVVPDVGGGLNAALASAATDLAHRFPGDALIAMVADLPSLRPQDFLAVLALAGDVERGFVPDEQGTGTTMLTVTCGQALAPAFGPGSALAHRHSGAVVLAAAASARCDVDTGADLARCLDLGVGPRTAALAGVFRPFT
jgi:2-phospho-L-lactate guanylyltransferase